MTIHQLRARVAASLDASAKGPVRLTTPSCVVGLQPTDPNPETEARYARERVMRRAQENRS